MSLMPHQYTGAEHFRTHRTAFLLDEAGTGKSATAITAVDRCGAENILVLPPHGVRNPWAIEIPKWSTRNLPVTVVEGADGPYLPPGRRGWTIASHTMLSRENLAEALFKGAGGRWDIIICDEFSEFRRFEARRTCNLFGDNGLWEHSYCTWLMDGDPFVNSALDFYPPIYGPLRRDLGPAPDTWNFGVRYSNWVRDGRGYRAIGVKNEADLAARLRPFTLRRTLESAGIHLPPLGINRIHVELPDEVVRAAEHHLANWQSPMQRAKLMQLLAFGDETRDAGIARARHVLGIAKVPAAISFALSRRPCGDNPLVLFYQHTNVRNEILRHLSSLRLRAASLDGTITKQIWNDVIDMFNAGALDVMLVQIQAGGRGLTLTRACEVGVVELPWTWVAAWQAIKRVHRITQTRAVNAAILCSNYWLDEAIARTERSKDLAARRLLSLLTT